METLCVNLFACVIQRQIKLLFLPRCFANYKNAISKGGGKEAVYNYGLALKAAAKYAEAKEIFLRYQKLNPDDPRGLMMAKSCDLAEKMIVEDPLYDVVEIKQWNTDGEY